MPSDPRSVLAGLGDGERATVHIDVGDNLRGPVTIHARRRGDRIQLDDGAAAVRDHRVPGWFETAQAVAAETSTNVNRRGVLFLRAILLAEAFDRAVQLANASALLAHELTDGERRATHSRRGDCW